MLSPVTRLSLAMPVVAMLGFLSAPALAQTPPVSTPAMYKWTKGDQQFFRWTEQLKSKTTGSPGVESEAVSGRVSTMTWDVTDVKDGIATVKATYNGYAVETQQPKKPLIRYDSLNPQAADTDGVLASVYGPIVGESFTFMVDGKGTVSKVEGMKAIVAKMREKAKDVQGSSTDLNDLNNTMSDERIGKNLERVLAGGSDKAVKAGDTWSDTLELPLPQVTFGSIKTERQITLKSIEKGVATIVFAIKISLVELKEGDPNKAMASMLNPTLVDGTGSGERTLNEKGQIIKSSFNLVVPIEMSYPGQGKIKIAMTFTPMLEKLDKLPAAKAVQAPSTPAPGIAKPDAPAPNIGTKPVPDKK